jgi:hypothetical protein
MKTALSLFFLLLIAAAGCRSPKAATGKSSPNAKIAASPETVLVTYRVKPGSEAQFEQVLAEAWKIYRKEHLVFAHPHIIVRDKEGDDRTGFVELFTWVSHDAPEHAPKSVTAIWDQETSLCESRNGHGGLEGGEVEIIEPAR